MLGHRSTARGTDCSHIPQSRVTYTKQEIDFFHRVFYDPVGSKRPFPKRLRCENKPLP